MRLHFLQHIWFEDLAYIKTWAECRNVKISRTAFFSDEPLPLINDFDWLVIMGGPMGVYDEKVYPSLIEEKKFIEKAVNSGKKVLGICLGAQLIAAAAGAKVYKNNHTEIGWFDVFKTDQGKLSQAFSDLPEVFTAFHWHGDTFDLPEGAKRLAQSPACMNQAFELNNNVIGLQFHLESTVESIGKLIENCGGDLREGKYIQPPFKIKQRFNIVGKVNNIMDNLLDKFFLASN
ncbi:MAG: type 1 glutamine amidotransferase [Planctomycetota bacterium]|jgi:GMP synthase (glutamine-hydrolysing)